MANHTWIAEVLSDIETYVSANGGRASPAAISFALSIAIDELGLDDSACRTRTPNGEDRSIRGIHRSDTPFDWSQIPCRLVIDNKPHDRD